MKVLDSLRLTITSNFDWYEIFNKLELSGILHTVAANLSLIETRSDRLDFILDQERSNLFNQRHCEQIEMAISDYLNRRVSIHIEIGSPQAETPFQREGRLISERQKKAEENLSEDEDLKGLIDRFNGRLDRESISPSE